MTLMSQVKYNREAWRCQDKNNELPHRGGRFSEDKILDLDLNMS